MEKSGKKFGILPSKIYLRLKETLEDFEDLKDLRKAKQESQKEPSIPFEKVKKDLGL